MSHNCKIPTPKKYVQELLDCIGYNKKLYSKYVLENSCGEGNILKEIVKRYIDDAIEENYSGKEIVYGLENYITAYDTDEECVKKCKDNLDKVALKYGLLNIKWNVLQEDYLVECSGKKYQYIIGNPPYITYHDLTDNQKKYLKENYETCRYGRFDYCYAFVEAGLRDLASDGRLAYILPYGVIRNKFAATTREYIKEKLVGIIDYKEIQIFDNAITSSVIILCDQTSNDEIFYYYKKKKCNRIMNKSELNGQWIFEMSYDGKNRFGDYFKVANSVATLFNKAFIFQPIKEDNDYYYIENGKIEKNIVFDAVSAKSEKKYQKNPYVRDKIIFPYKKDETNVERFKEDEFQECYPECYKVLQFSKEKLLKRKASEGVSWFEYGRSQAIKNIFKDKLVLSMVVTNKVNVFKANSESIPYAGAYIISKGNSNMSLNEAKSILESNEFYDYIKKCGTPTTPSSYRITVKDIEDYMF